MTTATPEESARCQDFRYYHRHLKIKDRTTKQLVPLVPNDPQIEVYNARCRADLEQRPFRGVACKARQVGYSTGWQSFTNGRAFTRSGVSAGTFAHDDDTTNTLHTMTETMYEELPDVLRPPKRSGIQGKRLVLQFPTGTSTIQTKTAGAREVGRGMNFTDVHGSEVAYWPDAETTLTALLQAVQPLTGTYVLLESTANGIGGVFYEMCRSARPVDPRWAHWCRSESEWEFFFTPWFDDAGYVMPLPAGGLGPLDAEEEWLVREFGVTSEQLAWRRWQIENQFGGNIDKFHQEMPATPEQAFLSSGRRFFAEERVSRIVIRTPKRRGELRGEFPAPYSFTSHSEGRLRYWEPPLAGHKYVVAVDPSGEIPEKEAEEYAGVEKNKTHDPSSMHVADCATGRLVAAWHDPHPDLSELGVQAAMLGKLYNHAMIGVETTGGYGWPVIQTLEQLRYRYVHTTRRQEVVDGKARWTTRLGYDTTETTRPRVLALLDDTIRDHPDALPDAELQSEMRTFVVRRRAQHDLGCHDDRVFSAAWALELARLYPQKTAVAA